MLARNSLLYFEVKASCSAFSSSCALACSTSVLGFDFGLLLSQELGFFLQLGVGLLELELLALKFFSERLRLLEQLFRAHGGGDGVEHDADGFHQLVEEALVGLGELAEGGQLDHRLHLALEQGGQHDDVEWRRFAQA
jgi:hypothetical protein